MKNTNKKSDDTGEVFNTVLSIDTSVVKKAEDDFNKTCACRGANLGKFVQPIILSILSKENCNGYQLIKKMENYSTFIDNKPDPTGIYRYLKAMVEKGLVIKIGEDEVYSVSPLGKECLNNWKLTLKDYCESINNLLNQLD